MKAVTFLATKEAAAAFREALPKGMEIARLDPTLCSSDGRMLYRIEGNGLPDEYEVMEGCCCRSVRLALLDNGRLAVSSENDWEEIKAAPKPFTASAKIHSNDGPTMWAGKRFLCDSVETSARPPIVHFVELP